MTKTDDNISDIRAVVRLGKIVGKVEKNILIDQGRLVSIDSLSTGAKLAISVFYEYVGITIYDIANSRFEGLSIEEEKEIVTLYTKIVRTVANIVLDTYMEGFRG